MVNVGKTRCGYVLKKRVGDLDWDTVKDMYWEGFEG